MSSTCKLGSLVEFKIFTKMDDYNTALVAVGISLSLTILSIRNLILN